MGDQLKTEPGWKPPRRGPSDRLLIALIGGLVAIAETWRAVVPSAQAAQDSEVVHRMDKLESAFGTMQGTLNAVVTDVAVLKDRDRAKK